jgi:hypothetical protein
MIGKVLCEIFCVIEMNISTSVIENSSNVYTSDSRGMFRVKYPDVCFVPVRCEKSCALPA